jgi:hypothetical protein
MSAMFFKVFSYIVMGFAFVRLRVLELPLGYQGGS